MDDELDRERVETLAQAAREGSTNGYVSIRVADLLYVTESLLKVAPRPAPKKPASPSIELIGPPKDK